MINNNLIESQIKDKETYNIYCYLCEQDNNVKVSEKILMSVFGRGKLFISKQIKNLKRLGLLNRIAIRGKQGKFIGSQLVVIKPGNKNMINEEKTLKPNNVILFKNIHSELSLRIEDDNSLERVMYDDINQFNKAIFFKKECLKDKKCYEMYKRLPNDIKDDKSFDDIRKECVSHYGSKIIPLLVCPQRFLTWIKREINFNTNKNNNLKLLGNGTYYSKYSTNLNHNDKSWFDDIGI